MTRENIIVAGCVQINYVEMFNWRERTCSPLQAMPRRRWEVTSFIYNNHMTVARGICDWADIVDDMIRMNIDPNPDPSTHWSNCPVNLPDRLACHSSVLYNDEDYLDKLIVSGGYNENGTSD